MPKHNIFSRLKNSLIKTSNNLGSGLINLFRNQKINDQLFEVLEEKLILADCGSLTSQVIIKNLKKQAIKNKLYNAEKLYNFLKLEMTDILKSSEQPLILNSNSLSVIIIIGVNGVGKTTTIGKLSNKYSAEGKSVMLAACDTFRAAAVEQLQTIGKINKIPVISKLIGSDPASIIFNSIQAAKSKNIDILIVDTAGRLHNKQHLMEELKKIIRVIKKIDANLHYEVILIIDANIGQNSLNQVEQFHELIGLTGIIVTKLDGTAKGGVIFSIADKFKLPIFYLGFGEQIDDLKEFNCKDYINAIFD